MSPNPHFRPMWSNLLPVARLCRPGLTRLLSLLCSARQVATSANWPGART
ncbi:hypothetical protein lerEdw1_010982 [Lerista edwardsae]|nr:hypothetical protein lerEdw1_010982 [Lerista edwardsae]